MHSATLSNSLPYRSCPITVRLTFIALVSLAMMGCRSSRPMGSMVQVTEDPGALVAEVPAPEQRLAITSATTVKREKTSGQVTAASKPVSGDAIAGMPAVFQTNTEAANKVQTNPMVKPTESPITASATSNDTGIEVSAGGLVSASLTDLSAPESKPANDQPPAPQAETDAPRAPLANASSANQSAEALVASATKPRPTVRSPSVAQTEQPHALTGAIQNSLAVLPALPNADEQPSSGLSPVRIGTAKEMTAADAHVGDQIVAATIETDSPHQETASPPPPMTELVFDDEPNAMLNTNQVLPVSHSGEHGKIDTAGHQLDTIAKQQTEPVNNPQPMAELTEPSAQLLSEAELYRELLNRVSKTQPNESPLQRERRQIVMRHLFVLAGDPDQAIDSMDGLNPTEQLYLQNQLMGLWTMIDPQGHPSSGRRITEALPKFREATRHMATATDSLTLSHLEFCTEIESYGQIKPFEGNRFAAGQQVILYCEVENFAAEERNGSFQTQLQGSYDIYDSSGTKVISQLLPVDQQRSRNRLRDYFVAYQMNLPKGLSRGTYRLQLTLEDAVGKKYGQANIPFEIN